ncbi:MAG: hypothetical protein AAFY58_01335 [Planctomycetota bacterium]
MKYAVIAAVAGAALATAANANLFVNAGFEDPITADGPPFVGSWEAFSGGGSAAAFNGTASPLSGAQHAEIQILGDDNNFAGMFQDVVVTAGTEYTFSGFHATPSNPFDVGVEYRIEWRDSVNDVEVGRTANTTIAPSGSTYEMFSASGIAPAGADLARVVYAIQTFGGDGPSNSGVIYLDDVSFIPAPGSLAILAGAGLGLTRRRR